MVMKNAYLTNTVVAQPFGKKDWVYLFLIISHFIKKKVSSVNTPYTIKRYGSVRLTLHS